VYFSLGDGMSSVIAKGSFVALLPLGRIGHCDTELAVVEFTVVRSAVGAVSAKLDIRIPVAGSGKPILRSYQLPMREPIVDEAAPVQSRHPVTYRSQGNWDLLKMSFRTLEHPEDDYVLDVEIDTWDGGNESPPLRALTKGLWQVHFCRLSDKTT
jgi:hypothetical protein